MPDDLRETYKRDNCSKEFRKACGAMSVYYDEKQNSLSVIVTIFFVKIKKRHNEL